MLQVQHYEATFAANQHFIMKFFFIYIALILSGYAYGQTTPIKKIKYPEKYHSILNFFQPYLNAALNNDFAYFKKQKDSLLNQEDYNGINYKKLALHLRYIELKPNNKDTNTAYLLGVVDSIIAKAIAINFNQLLVDIYFLKSTIYQTQKNHAAELESRLDMYNCSKQLEIEGIPLSISFGIYAIAETYYNFHDYETAINFSKESYNEKDPLWIKQLTTNLVGLCYLKAHKIDSSKVWFNKSLALANKVNEPSPPWQGITKGNLAYCYLEEGDTLKAKNTLEEALILTKENKVWDNVSPFASTLANICLKENNTTKALALLIEAENACHIQGNLSTYLKLHTVFTAYYKKIGNANLALLHQDSVQHYQNLQNLEYDINQKIKVEVAANMAKRAKEKQALDAQLNRQRLLRIGLIITIVLGSAIALLFYNRQRLRYKVKQQSLENKNLIANEKLNQAKADLKNFTQNLKEKNELIEKFAAELENLKANNTNIPVQQFENLEALRSLVILTDSDWETFRKMFEQSNPGFFIRLKDKFETISQAEIRFMAFSKLKLSNKEMANMLGVSTDAIRSIKSRLKKKLNLSDDTDFETLAENL